jgi:ATP-binding cassette subfamily B protein
MGIEKLEDTAKARDISSKFTEPSVYDESAWQSIWAPLRTKTFQSVTPPGSLFQFLVWVLGNKLPLVFLSIFLSAVAAGVEVLSIFSLGWIIDRVEFADRQISRENAILLLGIAALFLIIRPIVFFMDAHFKFKIIPQLIATQSVKRLMASAKGQSLKFFQTYAPGRLSQKMIQTSLSLSNLVSEISNTLTTFFATVLGSFAIFLVIDDKLALLLLVWLSLLFTAYFVFVPKFRAKSKHRANNLAAVSGDIVDIFSNILTVKGNFSHGQRDQYWDYTVSAYKSAALDYGATSAVYRTILVILSGLLPVCVFAYSLYRWVEGVGTIGDVTTASLISARLTQMMGLISVSIMTLFKLRGEIENGLKTLSNPWDIAFPVTARPRDGVNCDIVVSNVSTKYDGDLKETLKNISFEVKAGERLAIVGPSGSGKSTLLQCLLRLSDPQTGHIRIGRTDIREIPEDRLRNLMSFAAKDPNLLARSVRENIVFSSDTVVDEDIVEAAKLAGIHEAIVSTSLGGPHDAYDTGIGTVGKQFSDGQRQRLAIARSLLGKSAIQIYDEATSSLDPSGAKQIVSAILNQPHDSTVIFCTHQLNLISGFDRVLILLNGEIEAIGTPNDIYRQSKTFRQLWDANESGLT